LGVSQKLKIQLKARRYENHSVGIMPHIEELQNEAPRGASSFHEAGSGSFIKTTSVCYSGIFEDVHHELIIVSRDKYGRLAHK
jgi:hypothetical protein